MVGTESVEVFFLSALTCFLLGALSVVVYMSWTQAGQLRTLTLATPIWPRTGIAKVTKLVLEPPRPPRTDQRITGAGNIDEQLHKLVSLLTRDYLDKWYHKHVSPDRAFLQHVCHSIHLALVEVAQRAKSADLYPFFLTTLPETATEHLSMYKQALAAAASSGDSEVESEFFKLEPEDDPWSSVCNSEESRRAYLRQLTELLLFLLLSKEDFSCPPLREFLTDLLVDQFWKPLLCTLLQPDYLNATVLMLCKDSALTGDSFMAAVEEGGEELGAIEGRLREELQHRRSSGVTSEDQQRVLALEGVMEDLKRVRREVERGGAFAEFTAAESTEPMDLPALSLSAFIRDYEIRQEGVGRHAFYHVDVQCQHCHAPEEQWTTWRRFSDFHDLHLSLKTMLPSLPAKLTLPTHLSFSRLDSQLLESRLVGLQSYLQALLVPSFLAAHPQAIPQVMQFLNEGDYQRSGNELRRRVDSLVLPFRRNKSLSSKTVQSAETSSPIFARKRSSVTITPDSHPLGEEAQLEEDGVPLRVMVGLLDEVFDLRDQRQWLRRQITSLLNQLLGGTINRKIVEKVDWLVSPEQIAEYLRSLGQTLWPGGYPASSTGPPYERSMAFRVLLARAKLIGSVPDELRLLIGSERTAKGMTRVFAVYQSEALNRRLALRLLEGALDALFAGRSVRETLRKTRAQIAQRTSSSSSSP